MRVYVGLGVNLRYVPMGVYRVAGVRGYVDVIRFDRDVYEWFYEEAEYDIIGVLISEGSFDWGSMGI